MTIVDIAAKAGTSTATVSRVINNDPHVKESTRKRVQKILEEYGYVPNALGRNLRLNKSKRILTILPTISTPAYAELLRGLTDSATKQGYLVMFMVTDRRAEEEKRYLNLIETRSFDGIVLVATSLDDKTISAAATKYPIVSCNTKMKDKNISYVTIDNWDAAYSVTKYLLSLGHKNIAVIKYSNEIQNQNEREEGFLAAMNSAGVPVDKTSILCDTEEDDLPNQITQLLSKPNPPTAIISFSDICALVLMQYANDNAIKLGRDLDVVGFGNVSFSAYGIAPVTAITMPWYEIGENSFNVIFEQISEKNPYPKGIILPYSFVKGKTTRTLKRKNNRAKE